MVYLRSEPQIETFNEFGESIKINLRNPIQPVMHHDAVSANRLPQCVPRSAFPSKVPAEHFLYVLAIWRPPQQINACVLASGRELIGNPFQSFSDQGQVADRGVWCRVNDDLGREAEAVPVRQQGWRDARAVRQ